MPASLILLKVRPGNQINSQLYFKNLLTVENYFCRFTEISGILKILSRFLMKNSETDF